MTEMNALPLLAIINWQESQDDTEEIEQTFSDPLTDNQLQSKFPFDRNLNDIVSIWMGHLWCVECDAIVNSAEEYYTDRRGISEFIYNAAGPLLEREVTQIAMESNPSNNPVGCRTGEAIITNGYRLPCKKVIHTVGPRYNEKYKTAAENMLHTCYRVCMQTAVEHQLSSIVFSCIHSERKNYSSKHAIPIALRTIRRFLERYPGKISKVVLALPNKSEYDLYYEQMMLYFPRSHKEELRAIPLLPADTGNEIGETVLPERMIRVAVAPAGSVAPSVESITSLMPSSIPKPGMMAAALSSSSSHTPCIPVGEVDTSAVVVQQQTTNGTPNFGRVSVITGASSLGRIDEGFSCVHGDIDEPSRRRSSSSVQRTEEEDAIVYLRYLRIARTDSFNDIKDLNIISRCGMDFLRRQTVAITGCQIPPGVCFDRLLLYFIKIVEPICEKGDYSLVYFHANSRNKPSFGWLRKAYRLLPAKYKKNLKALYIVHPSFWLTLCIKFVQQFISEKFFEKLCVIDRLENLYPLLPADSIVIPEDITRYNQALRGAATGMPPPPQVTSFHNTEDSL
jgi:O-acetyl-ADP-ribose deacetylase (regulator of RNase III)